MATEDTKEKIIKSAIELFNARGFKSVTMDDVATSIHISKRTLYETFSSKDELVLNCLTQVHQELGRLRQDAIEKTHEPLLLTLFILRNTIRKKAKYQRLFYEAELYYPEINAQLIKVFGNQLKESLRTAFDEAEKAGDLCGNLDIDIAIDVILMSIRHTKYNENTDYSEFSTRMREACFTYLRGLLSVKAIERYDKNKEEFRKIIES